MSAAEAGAVVGLTGPYLNHIEAGRTAIAEEKLRKLLTAYGCSSETYIEELVAMVLATGKGWWSHYRKDISARGRDLAELESSAVALSTYEPTHLPGLLQSPEYVRALLTAGNPGEPADSTQRFIEFRVRRQEVLTGDDPPSLHAVIHEAAFHMRFVDADIMRRQLTHLIEVSRLPHITVQLVPFRSAPMPLVGTPFVHCHSRHPLLDTVYLESDAGSSFLSTPEQLTRYRDIFSRLSDVALPPIDVSGPERRSYTQRDSLSLIQHLLYVL
ncbi:Helix-turn-helix [Streptomyces aidingensis]|uniref:Helix-turn-helix n=2 Tax=Streptomyces aidingensis TaxID=910347 RepID=A0A1I1TDK8_9ACTN|nr:Helix-turn-helix [Streptomyces aidingensis]